MHWLLNRDAVIALALAGAMFSVAAGALGERLGKTRTSALSWLAYACMGTSMLLFVVLGFVAPR